MSVIAKPLLFSGNSNIDLAREIAAKMDTRLGSALVDKFKNDECRIEIKENVRGAEVFVIQSLCRAPNGNSVNDSLMELLLMMDALSRASANRITAIVPYYGYAKQDKKTKGREPISAKLVANLIEKAGAKRLVTLDLHAAQIQGFFDLPVDNLVATPTLAAYLKSQGLEGDKIVVVSPDAGGVPRAENFAKRLRTDVAIVFKRRPEPDVSEVTTIVGDVKGKIAVVVDDMISTGGTLVKASEALLKRGATDSVLHVRNARHLRRRCGQAMLTESSAIRKALSSPTRSPNVEAHPRGHGLEDRTTLHRSNSGRCDQTHHRQSFGFRAVCRKTKNSGQRQRPDAGINIYRRSSAV